MKLWGATAALALLACSSASDPPAKGSSATARAKPSASADSGDEARADGKLPSAKSCRKEASDFSPKGTYRHSRSRLLVTTQGDPKHAAVDNVVVAGSQTSLKGKFSYGSTSKDLEDEDVTLLLRSPSCSWKRMSTVRTDDDGWASFPIAASDLSEPGVYGVELAVEADGSRAAGWLFVLPKRTRAVLFDVDATLTTSDNEIIDEVMSGKVPEKRPSAEQVAQGYAERGFVLAYVTGRPYLLSDSTRRWLDDHAFPLGVLRTTDRVREASPSDEGVGRFKEKAIAELKASGLDFKVAYGNALTDICAYKRNGIDPKRTFILGPHGGKGCDGGPNTNALPGYGEHLADLGPLLLLR